LSGTGQVRRRTWYDNSEKMKAIKRKDEYDRMKWNWKEGGGADIRTETAYNAFTNVNGSVDSVC